MVCAVSGVGVVSGEFRFRVVALQVGEGMVEMNDGRSGGELRISDGDGVSDRGMLPGGGGETGGGVAGQAAQAPQMQAQPTQGVRQVGIAAGAVERGVELRGQGVVTGGVGAGGKVDGGAVEAVGKASEGLSQRRAVGGVGCVFCGATAGEGLQGDAQVEQLRGFGERDGGDDDPAPARGCRQTIGDEPRESFAERSAGQAQACGLLHFTEDRAWCEGAVDDLLTEGPVSPIAGTHTAECIQG